MSVTGKGGANAYNFLPVFVSCCARGIKLGEAESIQTTKAQTNHP